MHRLSRLAALYAGFWVLVAGPLAAAPAAFAQVPTDTEPAPELSDTRLSNLTIAQSSMADAPKTITVETAEIPSEPTQIIDERGALRLMKNEGTTLQWNGDAQRGRVWVAVTDTGHWLITGGQKGESGGILDLEGFITEIGRDHFVMSGTIKILGTPGEERLCNMTKQWRFEVTQNRSYYRLREFEWCDYLTDYIDVYFNPALR